MIRPARHADRPAIERIVADAFGYYVERLGKPPGPMLDDYREFIENGLAHVLEIDGQIVGYVILVGEPGGLLLENVAVAPQAQGRGHGRTLLAFAEQEARRRGRPRVRLYTNAFMVENIALYLSLGYVETHRAHENGYDRVFMTKELTPAP